MCRVYRKNIFFLYTLVHVHQLRGMTLRPNYTSGVCIGGPSDSGGPRIVDGL